MAVNTPSAWTEKRAGYTGTSLYYAYCTLTIDTANTQAGTYKTPMGLDVRRPWTLIYSADATPDSGQTPIMELWGGYSSSFALTNTSGVSTQVATDGAFVIQMLDDVTLAVTAKPFVFQLNPSVRESGSVADVVTVAAIATGFKVRIPVLPYYAFNINADSTFSGAQVLTFRILQA